MAFCNYKCDKGCGNDCTRQDDHGGLHKCNMALPCAVAAWKPGQRLRMTDLGIRQRMYGRSRRGIYARFVGVSHPRVRCSGMSRRHFTAVFVRVRRDGLKCVDTWHPDYWEAA